MSRIGRKPVNVPDAVTVTIAPGNIVVKGPKGELAQTFSQDMTVSQEENTILVTRPTDRGPHRALHGLTRSLIANMVEGVTDGFEKRLEIQGVGYRAAGRNRIRGAAADRDHRRWHRQAARRSGRRGHPQATPAGAVQGQGHPL